LKEEQRANEGKMGMNAGGAEEKKENSKVERRINWLKNVAKTIETRRVLSFMRGCSCNVHLPSIIHINEEEEVEVEENENEAEED